MMTPAEFRAIRKRAGLTGRAVALFTGTTDRTIRRYEAGEVPIPGPMAKLIRIMDAIEWRISEDEEGFLVMGNMPDRLDPSRRSG